MTSQQRYKSFTAFANAHGLLVSQKHGWRLTDRIAGAIHALPGSAGVLTATDGILCYIERHDGSLFLGHVSWFVPQHDTPPALLAANRVPRTGRAARVRIEYV